MVNTSQESAAGADILSEITSKGGSLAENVTLLGTVQRVFCSQEIKWALVFLTIESSVFYNHKSRLIMVDNDNLYFYTEDILYSFFLIIIVLNIIIVQYPKQFHWTSQKYSLIYSHVISFMRKIWTFIILSWPWITIHHTSSVFANEPGTRHLH